MTAVPMIYACTVCCDEGRAPTSLGDAMEPCRVCCCSACEEFVGAEWLVCRDGKKVCFQCAKSKCDGCKREFPLAALDDEDRCEECHVEQHEEPVEYQIERSAGGRF